VPVEGFPPDPLDATVAAVMAHHRVELAARRPPFFIWAPGVEGERGGIRSRL
jgi:hypothetical protein